MKKIALLIAGIVFAGCAVVSEAQILKGIDKRIERKVKDRVKKRGPVSPFPL